MGHFLWNYPVYSERRALLTFGALCREGYSSHLVCMYVCDTHAILAVRAIKSLTNDTVVLNVRVAAIL